MASYRPKSLDELNNLYDKAISAEKAIKKGTSLLGEENLPAEHSEPKIVLPEPKLPTPKGEISSDVNAFISQFSGEEAKKDGGKGEPQPSPTQNTKKEENLSGLMNDYVRIMSGEADDEDDEDDYSEKKSLFKSRRAEKKGRKKSSRSIVREEALSEPEQQDFQPAGETEPVFPEPEVFTETGGESLFAAEPEVKNSPAPVYSAPATPIASVDSGEEYEKPEEPDVPFERDEAEEEGFSFGEISQKRRPSAGKIVLRVLLIFLLVLNLLSVVFTGLCGFTVNNGKALGGKLFFTSSYDFENVGVKTGDLVVCEESASVEDEDKIVFVNREEGSFSFGVKNGGKVDTNGNIYYKVGSELVGRENVLGKVSKTVPKVGKLVKLVADKFLFVLLGLVALAVVLTLVLVFAFRDKEKRLSKRYETYYDDEEEDSQEQDETEHEESESHEEDSASQSDDYFDSDSLFDGIE